MYCYFCRCAYFGGFHPEINKIGETSLTFAGYQDWKNALARFSKHESGKVHCDCVYLVKQQQKPTVAARLSLAHQKQQTERRKMFLVQVECVKYLLRQGLALRGHIENEGNLIQLLKLRTADVHGLDSWVANGNYLSHDIINEICQIISLSIIRELIKEVRSFSSELNILYCSLSTTDHWLFFEILCFAFCYSIREKIKRREVMKRFVFSLTISKRHRALILMRISSNQVTFLSCLSDYVFFRFLSENSIVSYAMQRVMNLVLNNYVSLSDRLIRTLLCMKMCSDYMP